MHGQRWFLIAVAADRQRFMLIAEVAREARVSISSVRHWLRTGKLTSIRPARRRLIARDEFERFMRGLEEASKTAKRRRREAP